MGEWYIIHCFHLHCAVLCVPNVSVNATFVYFYGFCKVTVSEKACSVIHRFDIARTCTNDPSTTVLHDVNCLFSSLCAFAFQKPVLTLYWTSI